MSENKKPRIGVYIDGANVYHGSIAAGWHLDYAKLDWFLRRKYDLAKVGYYSAIGYKKASDGKKYELDADGNYIPDPRAIAFENKLRGLGFTVNSKPLKFIGGDELKPSNKMDGDLMIDALVDSTEWEQLVLVSGDCDFERLVKQMVMQKKKVHILSYKDRLSHELKVLGLNSVYVNYTLLDDLQSILEHLKK